MSPLFSVENKADDWETKSRCMDGTCMEYFILLLFLRLFMSHWIAVLCEESRKLWDGEISFFREWQITATRDSSKCDKAMQVSVSSNEQKPIKIKHIFTRIPEVALLFSSSSSVYPLPRYYWPRFPLTFYETSNESETIDKSQEKSTITEEQKEMHFICHVNHVWYLSCDLVPQKSFFYWNE